MEEKGQQVPCGFQFILPQSRVSCYVYFRLFVGLIQANVLSFANAKEICLKNGGTFCATFVSGHS